MPVQVSLLALVCASISAHAVDTTVLDFQVSTDGVSWASHVSVGPESTLVQCRLVVSYVTSQRTRPIGLASLFVQPTVSSWRAGDQLLPFAATGTNNTGGSVPDLAGLNAPYGRISPFASSGPGETDPYIGHVQNIRGTQYLRIARSSITNWVGQGPTTGAGAANNTNGSGGLAISQRAFGNVTPDDPPFRSGSRDLVVFKFAVLLAEAARGRLMSVSAPIESLTRDFQTGERGVTWYADPGDTFGQTRTPAVINSASIRVIPGPGVALGGLVGLGLWATGRRRVAKLV